MKRVSECESTMMVFEGQEVEATRCRERQNVNDEFGEFTLRTITINPERKDD
jgi:hypothetical protein